MANEGDDPQNVLRRNLRKRRRALGLTQDQVARLVDVPRLSYHRMEAGSRRIRSAEIEELARVLAVDVTDLLGELGQAHVVVRSMLGQTRHHDHRLDGSK